MKPSAVGLRTNLVITTDRRIYRLQAEATQRLGLGIRSPAGKRAELRAVNFALVEEQPAVELLGTAPARAAA